MDPLLLKWRASRNELPWSALTIEERCNSPLLFEPGTSWTYGMRADWAGKMVDRVTGETLETYMSTNIWGPLHLENIISWPARKVHMHDRVADISTLGASAKAVPLEGWDLINRLTDCLGWRRSFRISAEFLGFTQGCDGGGCEGVEGGVVRGTLQAATEQTSAAGK